mmetsp:Transcript_18704/g.56582  ORF Transcript_18704/g.56582 Transcript_18704/m.56582 type:complete len:110 (+) Transcript_18704:1096-1425(+)
MPNPTPKLRTVEVSLLTQLHGQSQLQTAVPPQGPDFRITKLPQEAHSMRLAGQSVPIVPLPLLKMSVTAFPGPVTHSLQRMTRFQQVQMQGLLMMLAISRTGDRTLTAP